MFSCTTCQGTLQSRINFIIRPAGLSGDLSDVSRNDCPMMKEPIGILPMISDNPEK